MDMDFHFTANTTRAANAYGFVPQTIEGDRAQWIQQHVANGNIVAEWSHRLILHSSAVPSLAELPAQVKTFWDALDCFSEGMFDILLCDTWYVAFPSAGRDILTQFRAIVDAKERGETPPCPALAHDIANDPFLLNQWGKVLAFCGESIAAGENFRESAERLRRYGEPYSNLGTLLWGLGKQREAFVFFLEGFLMNPHRTSVQLNFFDAVHELEEYEVLARVLEELLPYAPEYPVFRHHLAIAYYHIGRAAEAMQLLETVLASQPDDADAQRLLTEMRTAVPPAVAGVPVVGNANDTLETV